MLFEVAQRPTAQELAKGLQRSMTESGAEIRMASMEDINFPEAASGIIVEEYSIAELHMVDLDAVP